MTGTNLLRTLPINMHGLGTVSLSNVQASAEEEIDKLHKRQMKQMSLM